MVSTYLSCFAASSYILLQVLGEPKWILLIIVPKHVHHHINQIFPCETLLFMQPLTLTIYNSSNLFSIFTVELLVTYTWYGMINIYLPNLDSYVMYNIKSHTPLHFCLIFCQEVGTDYLGQLQTIPTWFPHSYCVFNESGTWDLLSQQSPNFLSQ